MPLSVPFKPLTLSQLLDTTFKFYRDNFKLLFFTIFSLQSIYYVVSKLLIGTYSFQFDPDLFKSRGIAVFIASMAGLLIIAVIVYMGTLGILTFMISDSLLGRKTSFLHAFRQIRPRFWPLMRTTFLGGIIMIVGFLLCVVPGFYFFFSYLLATQVVLLEGQSGMDALNRSKELMRTKSEKGFTNTNVFKASVLLLMVTAITYSVQMVTALPQVAYVLYGIFTSPGSQSPATPNLKSPVYIATELFSVMGYCLTEPLGMIALILLYYDIRSRREGLDLEMMVEQIASPDEKMEP